MKRMENGNAAGWSLAPLGLLLIGLAVGCLYFAWVQANDDGTRTGIEDGEPFTYTSLLVEPSHDIAALVAGLVGVVVLLIGVLLLMPWVRFPPLKGGPVSRHEVPEGSPSPTRRF